MAGTEQDARSRRFSSSGRQSPTTRVSEAATPVTPSVHASGMSKKLHEEIMMLRANTSALPAYVQCLVEAEERMEAMEAELSKLRRAEVPALQPPTQPITQAASSALGTPAHFDTPHAPKPELPETQVGIRRRELLATRVRELEAALESQAGRLSRAQASLTHTSRTHESHAHESHTHKSHTHKSHTHTSHTHTSHAHKSHHAHMFACR
jgi:hypothetical protein